MADPNDSPKHSERGDVSTDALDQLRAWAMPRARLFVTAVAAGIVAGGVTTTVLAVARSAELAATQAFAFGTLVLGFGVLGWAGAAFAGRGVENMQEYLDTGYEWSEADSRRAMTRVSGFGAGITLAVPPVATVLSRMGVA